MSFKFNKSDFSIQSLMPTDKKERIKLIAAVSVCAICLIWLSYFIISHTNWSGPAKPLTTPAWNTANELNAKLGERESFRDVGFSVVTEKPLRFKVNGLVHSPKDMDSLKTFLAEVRPENDYDMEVVILGQ